jgi:hypothetical protein
MNVPVDAMRESMKMRPPQTAEPAAEPAAAPAAPVAPTADPMQWWNALTQQFGELAANAMKELPTPAAAPQAAAAPAKKAAAAKRRPR